MAKRRLGVLTGGGDVPGLNPVIAAITENGDDEGFEVIGIKRGWGGLIYQNPDDKNIIMGTDIKEALHFVKLTKENTRTIYRQGGTVLHTSRVNPVNVASITDVGPDLMLYRNLQLDNPVDMTSDALRNIENLKLDYLVSIGGDDTQSFAVHLHKKGVNVIAIPKTMDNDINGTEYAIGFDTAVTRANQFITDLRTCMGSHERIGIIELFGRSAGFVALTTAYATNANRVVIPECEFSEEKLLDYLKKDRENNKSKYSLVLMAEGAKRIGDSEEIVKSKNKDLYGHEKLGGIGEIFKEFVERKTKRGTVFEALTYIIRCGDPTDFDQRIGKKYARMTIEHIVRGEYGKMMAVQDGKLTAVNIDLVTSGKRRVDIDKFYDKERYLPLNKDWDNTSVML